MPTQEQIDTKNLEIAKELQQDRSKMTTMILDKTPSSYNVGCEASYSWATLIGAVGAVGALALALTGLVNLSQ